MRSEPLWTPRSMAGSMTKVQNGMATPTVMIPESSRPVQREAPTLALIRIRAVSSRAYPTRVPTW
ncbi:hypothetical protein [Planobispora longispora]|uniref:hypothetical protein n=1 Tax=Planobispora longispora TaxID=28887 RepID=UPI003613534D